MISPTLAGAMLIALGLSALAYAFIEFTRHLRLLINAINAVHHDCGVGHEKLDGRVGLLEEHERQRIADEGSRL